MIEFVVDLTHVKTLDGFAEAFNTGFCDKVGGHLHSLNLDVFHDFLSWPGDEHYRLVFLGWEDFLPVLATIHKPSQKSYLENLREIFADNPHVEIVLN